MNEFRIFGGDVKLRLDKIQMLIIQNVSVGGYKKVDHI